MVRDEEATDPTAWAAPWIAFWECAALFTQASLEGLAIVFGAPSSPSTPLAALGRAVELQLRNSDLLRLSPYRPEVFALWWGLGGLHRAGPVDRSEIDPDAFPNMSKDAAHH